MVVPGDGEMLARFRAEARYATLVCHPGVVPVYGPQRAVAFRC